MSALPFIDGMESTMNAMSREEEEEMKKYKKYLQKKIKKYYRKYPDKIFFNLREFLDWLKKEI
jgi:hypothetical protein